jgi:hypothetical protein
MNKGEPLYNLSGGNKLNDGIFLSVTLKGLIPRDGSSEVDRNLVLRFLECIVEYVTHFFIYGWHLTCLLYHPQIVFGYIAFPPVSFGINLSIIG